MNDQRDDLLREIGEGLSIDPSASFAARVRADVAAAGPQARPWRRPWLGALALGAGVAGVVALMVLPRSASQPSRPGVGAERAERPVVAEASREPAAPSATAWTRAERRGSLRIEASAPLPSAPVAGTPAMPGPDLRVLTNQPALFRQMWARVAAEGLMSVEVETATTLGPSSVAVGISITDLTVAPIVVPDIVAGTGVPGANAGGGVRRVISAESSARSRE